MKNDEVNQKIWENLGSNRILVSSEQVDRARISLLDTSFREIFETLKNKGLRIYMIRGSRLIELKNSSEIEEHVHIVAINAHFLDVRYELQRFSYILQRPYSLVKEMDLPLTVKFNHYLLGSLHRVIASLSFKFEHYFTKG